MRHIIYLGDEKVPSAGPLDYCIYCADLSIPASSLTSEHIIPAGLGGNYEVNSASCSICQKKVDRFEQPTITRNFGATRDRLGVNSGRNRGKSNLRTRKYRVTVNPKTDATREEVQDFLSGDPANDPLVKDVADGIMFCETFGNHIPGLLMGTDISLSIPHHFLSISEMQRKEGVVQLGARILSGSMIRTVAKIAHAFTCAKLPRGSFEPIVPGFLFQNQVNFSHFVGSTDPLPKEQFLHAIELFLEPRCYVINGIYRFQRFYVVKLRLFAHMASPEYMVVTGVLPPL